MVRVYGTCEAGEAPARRAGRSSAMLVGALIGCVASVAVIAALSHSQMSSRSAMLQHATGNIPTHYPMMDHITLGVGNEKNIEAAANWALKHIGKTKGTLIEAMIKNGTIAEESEAMSSDMVKEVHQARKEQDPTYVAAPFKFEAATGAATNSSSRRLLALPHATQGAGRDGARGGGAKLSHVGKRGSQEGGDMRREAPSGAQKVKLHVARRQGADVRRGGVDGGQRDHRRELGDGRHQTAEA